jgi:large conductance mechanosensitive channel
MKKFLNEFKEFALKGNVLNLAVGIIIGAAFQNIVTSLTNNILSPIIGLFARQNFDTLQLSIFGVDILYGAFITSVINFLIIAFVVFMLVKGINKLVALSAPPPAPAQGAKTRKCPFCITEISIDAIRCPACTSHVDLHAE